ncbi:MAG TPA: guanine deaminase [Burkholderiales bacterium]|nr:guanine deaminase [Burkholderiales bacterium]
MSNHMQNLSAFRASILHFLSDPGESDNAQSFEFFEDGLLVVENGLVKSVGPASDLLANLPANIHIVDYSGHLIVPGFIDTHIHYPQTDIIASPGKQLLDWLEQYTFPAERKFADKAHASEVADFFVDELMRNGTTTALVFGTVHKQSVEAFFEIAAKRNLRMVAGKVLMDRNCPENLRDTAESGYRESAELLEKWNGHERLNYAITPRFAPTSSELQLSLAGKLAREFPDAHIQSHVAENMDEVAWVRSLFPDSRSYLDVYDRFGLLRDRAVYAHCIYLDESDRRRMAESGASAAFCPTSNLFLGSGLFDIAAANEAALTVGVGTDVGGGTSFSMLRTLGEAYKVAQLRGHYLSPLRAFYLATLGSAQSLGLDDRIGNLTPTKEADFVVLDLQSTPLITRRMRSTQTLSEKLFVQMLLADDRAVSATYILGQRYGTSD